MKGTVTTEVVRSAVTDAFDGVKENEAVDGGEDEVEEGAEVEGAEVEGAAVAQVTLLYKSTTFEPSCDRPPPNMATFPTVVAAKKERATLSSAVDHTLVTLL